MQELAPGTPLIRRALPADSSIVGTRWNQLVVLDDIEGIEKGPLTSSPAQFDKGKPGGTVEGWMGLPWGAPDQLVLPGYRTVSENGLRGRTNGDEMLLSVCGLMASGVPTSNHSPVKLVPNSRPSSMALLHRTFVENLPSGASRNSR